MAVFMMPRSHEEHASQQKKLPPGVSAQEYVQVHLKRLEFLAKIGFSHQAHR
jgi:hypothetical protein